MRTIFVLGVILLVAGFYVGWPAYNGVRIQHALETKQPELLRQKIDFERVRVSLRPAVEKKVAEELGRMMGVDGPAADLVLAEEVREQALKPVVDAALATLVTPEMLIRIHAEGQTVGDAVEAIVAQRAAQPSGFSGLIDLLPRRDGSSGNSSTSSGGGFGALGAIAKKLGVDPSAALGGIETQNPRGRETSKGKSAPQSSSGGNYGLDNIKNVSFPNPLAISVGLARDPSQRESELDVEMGFVDGDWKLTGLVPKL